MQQNFPFAPTGTEQSVAASTIALAVTASAQQLALPLKSSHSATVRLVNVGSQVVFVLFGNLTVTTSGTALGMPLLPGSVEVFSLPPSVTQLSAIAAATGSTLYVTCGEGC